MNIVVRMKIVGDQGVGEIKKTFSYRSLHDAVVNISNIFETSDKLLLAIDLVKIYDDNNNFIELITTIFRTLVKHQLETNELK